MGDPEVRSGSTMTFRDFVSQPGVRRHPLRLTTRRVRYEVERRLRPAWVRRERVARVDGSVLMGLRPLDAVEGAIYRNDRHEPLACGCFLSLLEPGDVVIDIGAHIGQYALLSARRVGSTGRVVAVEPQPEVRCRLKENVRRNRLQGVVTVRGEALGDSVSIGRLVAPPADSTNSGLAKIVAGGAAVGGLEVPVTTLDALVDDLHLSRVDAVKIDVEGSEYAVLTGGSATLERHRPSLLVEINDLATDGIAVDSPTIGALFGAGYHVYGIHRGPRGSTRLESVWPDDRDLLSHCERWSALNLLAVAAEEAARRSPRAAGQHARNALRT